MPNGALPLLPDPHWTRKNAGISDLLSPLCSFLLLFIAHRRRDRAAFSPSSLSRDKFSRRSVPRKHGDDFYFSDSVNNYLSHRRVRGGRELFRMWAAVQREPVLKLQYFLLLSVYAARRPARGGPSLRINYLGGKNEPSCDFLPSARGVPIGRRISPQKDRFYLQGGKRNAKSRLLSFPPVNRSELHRCVAAEKIFIAYNYYKSLPSHVSALSGSKTVGNEM